MSHESERIEWELDETRGRLTRNLEALSDRLSPGHVLDEAMRYFNAGPRDVAMALGDQVRANPLATVVTGAGLAWLAFGRHHDGRMWDGNRSAAGDREVDWYEFDWYEDDPSFSEIGRHNDLEALRRRTARQAEESDGDYYRRLDDAYAGFLAIQRADEESEESYRHRIRSAVDTARDRANEARERLRKAAQTAGTKARGAGRRAAGMAHSARDGAAHMAHSAREGAAHMAHSATHGAGSMAHTAGRRAAGFHEDNPLVVGIMALAAGAIAGSLFPVSRQEREAFGPLADEAVRRGAGLAEHAAEKGAELSEQAAAKVDEATEAGRDKLDERAMPSETAAYPSYPPRQAGFSTP